MKRRDLLKLLNKETVRYNLVWDDIKDDCDKAIIQINGLLGANFPMLSHRLFNDDAEYTDRIDGVDVPIIKDDYFYSIIIPFVSMEVLARDEEFTTVFSKHQQDLMQGKFHMFSNEFNHIPDRYKRTRVEGVFFPSNNLRK